MAQIRQYTRGTATRPIIRDPQTSTDVTEERIRVALTRGGRRIAPNRSNRPNRIGNALAGSRGGGVRLKSGVWNGPVGSR